MIPHGGRRANRLGPSEWHRLRSWITTQSAMRRPVISALGPRPSAAAAAMSPTRRAAPHLRRTPRTRSEQAYASPGAGWADDDPELGEAPAELAVDPRCTTFEDDPLDDVGFAEPGEAPDVELGVVDCEPVDVAAA